MLGIGNFIPVMVGVMEGVYITLIGEEDLFNEILLILISMIAWAIKELL